MDQLDLYIESMPKRDPSEPQIAHIQTLAIWPRIKPYLHAERYTSKGAGGAACYRIELVTATPPELALAALADVGRCVACKTPIHNFRARQGPVKRQTTDFPLRNIYYASTCSAQTSPGCCRGKAARNELASVAILLKEGK